MFHDSVAVFFICHGVNNRYVLYFDWFGWVGHVFLCSGNGKSLVLKFEFSSQISAAVAGVGMFCTVDTEDEHFVPGLLSIAVSGEALCCLDRFCHVWLVEVTVEVLESVYGV